MGTTALYEFVHNNPLFCFRPTEYVNDPFIIGMQHKMVAINMALEIDLTGQVCADSLGSRFYSGIGGQVDFNRGAARSKGGKAIIACPPPPKTAPSPASLLGSPLAPAWSPPVARYTTWSPSTGWPTCTARVSRTGPWH